VVKFKNSEEITIQRLQGPLRTGTIVGFNPDTSIVDVEFGQSIFGPKNYKRVQAQLPASFLGTKSGSYIGGYPESGTPVLMAPGDGNIWFIVSYLPQDPSTQSSLKPSSVPDLKSGTINIRNKNNYINLDYNDGIFAGDDVSQKILDTKRSIAANTFKNNYSFSEGGRSIDGIIFRDVKPNAYQAGSLKETDLKYTDTLKIIGMDPVVRNSSSNEGSYIKNPSRVEKREIVFEYAKSYNVSSNDVELNSYKDSKNITISSAITRRNSRADALSLSLVSPNFLMETIKGTVVDIYGNILDLNRNVIPIGKTDDLSLSKIKDTASNVDDGSNVYLNIKRSERRSVAFHFELNARKDLLSPPEASNQSIATQNYGRDRSRFYFDVDKEGQFKLNVPASSEYGNVGLLARYENYSTVYPNDQTKDPNDYSPNDDNIDVLLDSFAKGVVDIVDKNGRIVSPLDRFSSSSKHLKHGTVYHDISNTCIAFQSSQISSNEYQPTTSYGLGRIPFVQNIVSNNIIFGKNAGGRSGNINFDGSIEVNIGANTIDRQSVWLDTQGGIIGNVGRDLNNNISVALSCDGEILISSGGTTPSEDTRFTGQNNAHMSGVIDMRVFNSNSNEITMIRIDSEGVTVSTPGRIVFYSNQDMLFRSKSRIAMEAPVLELQDRIVKRDPGAGSI